MANLAAILDKEASAEIEAILSEAQNRASEIVAKAKEEAQSLIAQKERALSSQHEAAIVRAKSAAQLAASSLTLRSQNDGVVGVFDKVNSGINDLMKDKGKYKKVMNSLFKEASGAVGKVTSVIVNPADKDVIDVPDGVKIETDDSVTAGVKLRSEGSNATVENSLFSRLDSLRDELASDVSNILFKK